MLELDADKRAEFFQINLGGGAYWQMLLRAGHQKDEIAELVNFHMSARSREVIQYMGGQALYDSIPRDMRDALFALSTVRYLCDSLHCWNPKVMPEYSERFVAVGREDERSYESKG